MKKCFRCKEIKSEDEFYKNKTTSDGLSSYCRCCGRIIARDYCSRNRDKVSKYHREYGQTNEYFRKYFHKNSIISDKVKARRQFNKMIKRTGLKNLPCEICGDIKSEAHHDDYSKPFEVRWLCGTHHMELHRKTTPPNQVGRN